MTVRKTNATPAYLIVLIVLVAILVWGCGDESGHTEVVDPHAGHDHGPGEHGLVTKTPDDDPHAGHDHGPGEHGEPDEQNLDWCAEHAVPESVCTQCHPGLIADFKATGDWCAGHNLPESHCRLCNPGLSFSQEVFLPQSMKLRDSEIEVSLWFRPNSTVCATDGSLIQFASEETGRKTGLTLQTVRQVRQKSTIEAPAEVVYDESHATVVTSSVEALVARWVVSPGDRVKAGEVLAILSSPDMPELQSNLLARYAANEVQQKEVTRHRQLRASDLISDAELERQEALGDQTLAEVNAARGMLQAAGLSRQDIDDIIEYQKVTSSFPLRASSNGVVVERLAKLGAFLEAGSAFALVADPSSMWIEARVTEEQLRAVDTGQTLLFASDGRGLDRVGAEIIWVANQLDPHSRTGTVRARVVDPDHRLQAGEFGRVTIVNRGHRQVVLVPKDAVQWEGCCNVVFVKESAVRYRPRKVDLLGNSGRFYQVSGNIKPGEDVVVDGSFLLKTELQRASLGTGCCGLEPTG